MIDITKKEMEIIQIALFNFLIEEKKKIVENRELIEEIKKLNAKIERAKYEEESINTRYNNNFNNYDFR